MLGGEGTHPDECTDCGIRLVLGVHQSAAGFYIGTWCACGPYSRESDYFATREDAAAGLTEWQADLPRVAARTPGYIPDPNFTITSVEGEALEDIVTQLFD